MVVGNHGDHEAGHAVVGYALGMGCTSIEIKESYDIYDGKLGVAVGGRVQGAPSIGKRLKKQIERAPGAALPLSTASIHARGRPRNANIAS